jgi:preprotein translocase subunit YajC
MSDPLLAQAAPPPSALPPSSAPPATGTHTSAPSNAPSGGPMGGCGPGLGNPMVLVLFMFVVMYFMVIRPQQKKAREQQRWLSTLKKGDEVVTSGGVIGRISALADNTVTIEVQDKVRIKVVKSHISGKSPEAKPAAEPVPDTDKK